MNKKTSVFIGRLFKKLPPSFREKLLEKARKPFPSSKLSEQYSFSEEKYKNVRTVWINKTKNTEGVLVFLHGGSYMFGPMDSQWEHYCYLCEKTGFSGIVIDYRKSKTAPYPAAVNDVKTVIYSLTAEGLLRENNWAIVGESAGGGLGAVVCRQLLDANKQLPKCMVLISPWVNLDHSNPEIKALEKLDPFLSLESINRSASVYAGEADLKNPNISPLFAEGFGMPSMLILAGSIDALVPDMRIYYTKMEAAGVDIEYFEEPTGVHVFPAFLEDNGAQRGNKQIIIYLKKHLSKF